MMRSSRTLPLVLMLATSGTFFSAPLLAVGPGGPHGQEPVPQEQRGGPDMPRHFAYKGHDFERGKPVPEDYRGGDYRVSDWHDKGLPPPPEGQHWAYVDGNYVLIAATTGIITSIILNSAHPQ